MNASRTEACRFGIYGRTFRDGTFNTRRGYRSFLGTAAGPAGAASAGPAPPDKGYALRTSRGTACRRFQSGRGNGYATHGPNNARATVPTRPDGTAGSTASAPSRGKNFRGGANPTWSTRGSLRYKRRAYRGPTPSNNAPANCSRGGFKTTRTHQGGACCRHGPTSGVSRVQKCCCGGASTRGGAAFTTPTAHA